MNTPAYEIATERVNVPTIISREMGPEGQKVPWVCIQSDAQLEDGGVAQFFFPVECSPSDDFWRYGELSLFHVVFIGMVSDWLQPEVVDGMIEDLGEEVAIAWVMAPHDSNSFQPILSRLLSIPLSKEGHGSVIPVNYQDSDRLKLVDLVMPLIDQMLKGSSLFNLPPEVIPWGVAKEMCGTCFQLQNSNSEKPGIPLGGNIDDLSWICPTCRRRWWQYNDHFHLWKHVTDPGEWDSIRRQAILLDAGYILPEQ